MARNEFEIKAANTNNMRKSVVFPTTDGIVATVNGVVRVRMFIRCSIDLVGDGILTIRTGNPIVTVNISDLKAGKLVLKDGTVKNAGLTNDVIVDFVTAKNIVIENFEAVTAGKIVFNIWSEPLTMVGELLV